MMTKTEYRDAWVTALRSGEYKQGRNSLNCNGAYCCLGVLADLAIKNNWFPELNIKWRKCNRLNNQENHNLSIKGYDLYCCLHFSLADEFGLSDEFQGILIDKNDAEYCSFNEIADYIEKNLKV